MSVPGASREKKTAIPMKNELIRDRAVEGLIGARARVRSIGRSDALGTGLFPAARYRTGTCDCGAL